jgi:heme-degrading monooxygenase HmoA
MVVERWEVTVVAGQESAFEAALCEVRQRVFMSPGFRGFTVAQGLEHPSTYLVQVRWQTAAELVEYAGSGRQERAWAPVEPFLAGPPRVDAFDERLSLGFQGPGVVTDLTWVTD